VGRHYFNYHHFWVVGLVRIGDTLTLELGHNQLTSVKGLENLTQLTKLNLNDNPDLTEAQIAELQKALPKCKISSNPTKQPALPFLPQQHLHQCR
jgi:hypothetical protein